MEWNGMKSFVQNRCKIRQKRSPGLSKFECGSLAIRGRRGVTRHDLGKFSVFCLRFSSTNMGEIAGGLEERLRGNMPKNLRKFRKIVPRASKIEPGAVQDTIFKRPIT